MDLIANLIVAACANGTHQRLAFDALEHMTSADRPGWKRLILKHGERYAEGASGVSRRADAILQAIANE